MRTIAVAMQKGGTGKTSIAVNLAAALAERGRSVIVLDLDPQHNASDWLRSADPDDLLCQSLATGKPDLSDLVTPTGFGERVACIPSSSILSRVEHEGAVRRGRTPAELLAGRMGQLRADYAVIDCPPGMGTLSLAALAASDIVLAPALPDAMSIAGLQQIFESVEVVRAVANVGLRFLVVFNRYTNRTRHAREVEAVIRKEYGRDVLRSTIRASVRMAEAWGVRQNILEHSPRSTVAVDVRGLANEMERKL